MDSLDKWPKWQDTNMTSRRVHIFLWKGEWESWIGYRIISA
jgi:hypothetical protein